MTDEKEISHEEKKKTRRRSYRFIAVFVVCVLAFLAGYRFIIPTRANDWYLFQVRSQKIHYQALLLMEVPKVLWILLVNIWHKS